MRGKLLFAILPLGLLAYSSYDINVTNDLDKDFELKLVTLGRDSEHNLLPGDSYTFTISSLGGVFSNQGNFILGMFPKVKTYKNSEYCQDGYKFVLNGTELATGIHGFRYGYVSNLVIKSCD